MKLRDLLLLALVCFTWAVHTIVSKIVVSGMEIPPLFYAALRYGLVAILALPWLLPLPRPLWRTALVGLLMGAGGFALFFTGIKTATPSGSAVVQQLGLPMMTLLSVVMLGEIPDRRRWFGSALTFSGAILVMWDPAGLSLTGGLVFVAASAFVGSLASVMMKQVHGVRPLQFQAWVGLTSVLVLTPLTAALEDGQIVRAAAAGWPFVAAVLFSAVVVSLLTHTIYYGLLLRYPANLLAPLMVLNPLMTVALGIAVTHDPFDLRMGIGTALALLGVLIVSTGGNPIARLRAWARARAD
ncbi:MAG TPA: DMT family transporter [Microvirga sp.]|jgi:drug/metabolite transporter (DMT)-like permease|nr:DMT family transporter [Microvirga sp.]